MIQKYKAVLFDFDGVLADSHGDNVAAWRKAFAAMNIPFDEHKYLLLEGNRSPEIIRSLLESIGANLDCVEKLIAMKHEFHAADAKFKLYPKVQEVVQQLKSRGLQIAVVSGGSRRRLFNKESETFLRTFDVVIAGEDCKLGKPHPDPYLKAAEQLGLKPDQCLVIENAPLGIRSAKSAKMACVAIASTLAAEDLNEADFVLASIDQLLSLN